LAVLFVALLAVFLGAFRADVFLLVLLVAFLAAFFTAAVFLFALAPRLVLVLVDERAGVFFLPDVFFAGAMAAGR
jgi:hypothetical protein